MEWSRQVPSPLKINRYDRYDWYLQFLTLKELGARNGIDTPAAVCSATSWRGLPWSLRSYQPSASLYTRWCNMSRKPCLINSELRGSAMQRRPSLRSVSPSSTIPPSLVMLPPSNRPSTTRRPSRPKFNRVRPGFFGIACHWQPHFVIGNRCQ